MILRLALFILAYALAGSAALVLGARLLKEPIAKYKRRALGRKNLRALEARDEICAICDESIDVQVDLFDKTLGWHHKRCRQQLLE